MKYFCCLALLAALALDAFAQTPPPYIRNRFDTNDDDDFQLLGPVAPVDAAFGTIAATNTITASNGLYSVSTTAGKLFLGGGTGTGGITNFSGTGYYQSPNSGASYNAIIDGSGNATFAQIFDSGLSSGAMIYSGVAGQLFNVTIGSGVSFSGGTLSATGSGGTVTSIGISGPSILSWSPATITTSGTFTGTLVNQNANLIFAGPSSGGAGTPLFRLMVGADIPSGIVANASLVNSSVTINGTAGHIIGGGTVSLGGTLTLDVGSTVAILNLNNVWTSQSSNFVNNAVTTWATNANNTTPDFAIPESTLSTNASFTWLAPTHKDTTGKVYQMIVIELTNSSGANITMTLPANVHQSNAGTGLVLTNWGKIIFEYNGPSGPTNALYIPGW